MVEEYHDGEGSWSFGNDFARNIKIFGVDNNSSSHTHNGKNNFLVLGEGRNQGLNDSTGSAEKNLVLTLVKQTQKISKGYQKILQKMNRVKFH